MLFAIEHISTIEFNLATEIAPRLYVPPELNLKIAAPNDS